MEESYGNQATGGLIGMGSAAQRHIEGFMAESWVAYLRQLERMTNTDHAIEDRARSFHQGSAPPTGTTLIAEHAHWKSG